MPLRMRLRLSRTLTTIVVAAVVVVAVGLAAAREEGADDEHRSTRRMFGSRLVRRVAVVTGGNKGIGFEIVKQLAAQPDVHTILTARSMERGRAACDNLRKAGIEVGFHALDIANDSSIAHFRDWIQKEHGGLDILCNNAGIAFKNADPTPFKDQADTTFKTNYWGTAALCDSLIPLMREGGSIVSVASQSGSSAFRSMSPDMQKKFVDPSLDRMELDALAKKFCDDAKAGRHREEGWANTCYGTSKLAVIALTRILADKLKPKNIICNCMCPGYCKTDMTSQNGYRSAAAGADTAVWLAMQNGEQRPTGKFFHDRRAIELKA